MRLILFFLLSTIFVVGKMASGMFVREKELAISLRPLEASYHGQSLKKSSFGFTTAIAGVLWIKLLQDASHAPIEPGEVSWEFTQLDAITTLDPDFLSAYDFGVAFLSVFRRDKLGAKIILEKWVKRFPNYWRPNYLLGIHLYFEMNEHGEAARYMVKAASLKGAPPYLAALGVRLLSQAGGLSEALRVSFELYGRIDDYEGRYRLRRRVRALSYELQRLSWEEALVAYRKRFGREPARTRDLVALLPEENRRIASMVLDTESELAPLVQERFEFSYDAHAREVRSVRSPEELGVDKVGVNLPSSTRS